jgi:hypothetical protein
MGLRFVVGMKWDRVPPLGHPERSDVPISLPLLRRLDSVVILIAGGGLVKRFPASAAGAATHARGTVG